MHKLHTLPTLHTLHTLHALHTLHSTDIAYEHTNMNAYIHTYIHADRQTDLHTDIHTDIHTDTYRYIQIHTGANTYILSGAEGTHIHTYLPIDFCALYIYIYIC